MALAAYYAYAQSDMVGALAHYQKAMYLADSTGSPIMVGQHVLCVVSQLMILTGNAGVAQKHASRAQESAEHLGSIFQQAEYLCIKGLSHIMSGNYSEAQILLKEAIWLLISCGLGGCTLELHLQNFAAEVHLLRTEYLESRNMQVSISATSEPTGYLSISANLNIALIDIVCGIESRLIRKKLEQCQLYCKSLYGLQKMQLELVTDQ
jgi:tetratricopeptide (TPR) repeat protein